MHGEGPLLILAGAGSGKTRALTARIARLIEEGVARPQEILAITFTNKAAGEMRERVTRRTGIRPWDLWVTTFHAAAARILRQEIEPLGYPSSFAIFDAQDQGQVVRRVLKDLNLDENLFPARSVHHFIDRMKNDLVGPEDLRAENFREEMLQRVYRRYEAVLRENGAVDFNDLIGLLIRRFETDPECLGRWRRHFPWIMVDEYQDTNPAQYRLVRLLGGPSPNLAVVGDPDQSIYGWRGADVNNILRFQEDFPGARVVMLTRNYRSTARILEAANHSIRFNRLRPEKELWTEAPPGDPIRFIDARDEQDEAERVVAVVRDELRRGRSPRELAVLFRTNPQSRVFEEAMIRHQIPYRLVGGVRYYERAEVKDLIAYLRVIQCPTDQLSLERAMGAPRRGIGAASVERLREAGRVTGAGLMGAMADPEAAGLTGRAASGCRELHGLISRWRRFTGRLSELVAEVASSSGLVDSLRRGGGPEDEARAENVEQLVVKAAEFERLVPDRPLPEALAEFLASVALMSDQDTLEGQDDRVVLMTLHAAKGLEFPVVFLAGMEEGLFPHRRALDGGEAELEEERRLFYVGVTRAQASLYLARARSRTLRGSAGSTEVSRFVRELPTGLVSDASARALPVRPGPARAGPSAAGIRAGARVTHPHFGRGVVLNVRGEGIDAQCQVVFEAAGIRTLLVEQAGLRLDR